MPLDSFTTFTMVGGSFLVFTFINLLRNLTHFGDAESRNAVVTQVTAWVGGVLAAVLMAQADIAKGLPMFGTTMAKLDGASLAIVGLLLASAGGAFKTFLSAHDQTQTAAVPPLLPGSRSSEPKA